MLHSLYQRFLKSAAPGYVNLVLVLETAMGLMLLIGGVLARKQRFRAHAWCQSMVVLSNAAIVIVLMIPSFHFHVSPKIPERLGKPYYALATAHATLGSIAELVGLYILLAAGTSILPDRFRLTKYRVWMRSLFALWWLVLVLGWITYARWYVPK